MTEPKKYNPTELEEKWYAYWLAHNYFHSTPDERTPYTLFDFYSYYLVAQVQLDFMLQR